MRTVPNGCSIIVRAMQQELAELTDSVPGNGGLNIKSLISKMQKWRSQIFPFPDITCSGNGDVCR